MGREEICINNKLCVFIQMLKENKEFSISLKLFAYFISFNHVCSIMTLFYVTTINRITFNGCLVSVQKRSDLIIRLQIYCVSTTHWIIDKYQMFKTLHLSSVEFAKNRSHFADLVIWIWFCSKKCLNMHFNCASFKEHVVIYLFDHYYLVVNDQFVAFYNIVSRPIATWIILLIECSNLEITENISSDKQFITDKVRNVHSVKVLPMD